MAQFFAKWLLLLTPASWGNKVFVNFSLDNDLDVSLMDSEGGMKL